MRIVGEWHVGTDGTYRPTVKARVHTGHGSFVVERFLVDSGADRTVFCASLLAALGLPQQPPPPGSALAGVGGSTGYVVIHTTVELVADDNSPARMQGSFWTFTDPSAADESILGRDVLNHFHLIISRPANEVLLLALNHQYRVERVP
jgi:hypothetical protein